jgi:hypothetical protein
VKKSTFFPIDKEERFVISLGESRRKMQWPTQI